MKTKSKIPHIVIVGGGAGGIELAARLGKLHAKNHSAIVTLVDTSPTHVWKPLLHEVAAGTLVSKESELDYLNCASQHHFQFCLGTMESLDRKNKTITLAPMTGAKQIEIVPRRQISYSILVMAVGSCANDFSTPGVKKHCYFLDTFQQSRYFQQQFMENILRLSYQIKNSEMPELNITVIGAGATGVELIAELQYAVTEYAHYGVGINTEHISFTLVEAGERILPMLEPYIAKMTTRLLQQRKIKILTNTRISKVTKEGLTTANGQFIPSQMMVWAAGIKGADFLAHLDGLEVNTNNQLCVKQTLQTTLDDSVFAFGDCASCPQTGSTNSVPPRAQAAHQQASFLVGALNDYLNQQSLPQYHYRDFGSLVSLGKQDSIGQLISKNFIIKGMFARLAYRSLFKMHQIALFGAWRVTLLTITNLLSRKLRPRVKLH